MYFLYNFYFLCENIFVKKRFNITKERLTLFQAINQTFESIKDIKILKKENFFESNLLKLIRSQEKQKLFLSMTNSIPRFILEIITKIIIFLIIFFSKKFGLSEDKIVTTITFLSFSALRIIPAFRTLNTSINNIIFNLPSLDKITDEAKEFDELKNLNYSFRSNKLKVDDSIIKFNKLKVENIFYKYDENLDYAIKDISFEIKKGEKVGLIGSSGSGKTTLINCVLGLLNLDQGFIKSEGINISDNLNSWVKQVGYVPQDIYLLDDSVKKNIAFGLHDNEISIDKLNYALETSNCLEFLNTLPNV